MIGVRYDLPLGILYRAAALLQIAALVSDDLPEAVFFVIERPFYQINLFVQAGGLALSFLLIDSFAGLRFILPKASSRLGISKLDISICNPPI